MKTPYIAIKSYINNKASEWFGTINITLASLTRYTMSMIQKYLWKKLIYPTQLSTTKKNSQKKIAYKHYLKEKHFSLVLVPYN